MGKKLYCSETAYNPYREINEREITESIFVIDGYSIADRLLEGVRFNVHFGDDKILSVNVDPDDAGFFSQFNEKMFLKQVEDYAKRTIEGDEVDIPEDLKKKYNWTNNTAAYIK